MTTSPLAAADPLPALRQLLDDRVITADDTRYDQLRTVFPGGFDRRPAAILRPKDAADVATAVTLARDTGLPLAVRAGGHSLAAHGVFDGSLVIDVRDLASLEVDVAGHTAWAGAGLTTGAYTTAVAEHGLVTGFGDTGTVGIAGITLAGGIGFLVRKHGLTIDNLLAAEVVTSDGQVRRVDAESEPDLFWAIRGGGGNFGVATRFQFRLHELAQIVGGMLMLPATPEVVAGFVALAEDAPDELSAIANVMVAPPLPFIPAEHHGEVVVLALMAYAGSVDDGERVLAPFRSLATPLADMLQPMPYPGLFLGEEEDYHPTAASHNMFIDHVDAEVAATILTHLEASDAPVRAAQLRVLGGAMARVPTGATAFAHRASRIMVQLAAFYATPDERADREAWAAGLAAALPQGDDGAYVGFLGDEGAGRVRAAYPDKTWDRLTAIKVRYDPTNLFRGNHNIPPVTT